MYIYVVPLPVLLSMPLPQYLQTAPLRLSAGGPAFAVRASTLPPRPLCGRPALMVRVASPNPVGSQSSCISCKQIHGVLLPLLDTLLYAHPTIVKA